MEQQLSLANLNFGETQITIYGTQQDPMMKCTDLIKNVLGYRDASQAKWFTEMKTDSYYVQTLQNGVCSQMMFTEMGIYKALMKSHKPIAEQFQKQVCELLKSIRLQTIQQLQETQLALEEQKVLYGNSKKVGYIYGLRHKKYKTIDYVGYTENTISQRVSTHIQTCMQSLKIPFYKILLVQAFQNYEQIELEKIEYYQEQELRDRETYWQLFTQSIHQSNNMKCQKCKRQYKQITSFEKHRSKCYGNHSLTESD